MKSIKTKTIYEQEIKKSRFISVLAPVFSDEEANAFLDSIKQEYPNANHYTFAYVLGDQGITQKASDDGEPTRTAGFPILENLLKNELTNIIAIVIRYFGGIKLGKGGLIRAYSGTVSEAIKKVIFTTKTTVYDCLVSCNYDNIGAIDKILREQTILQDVKYDKDITFYFQTDEFHLYQIKELLYNKNGYEDKVKILKEDTQYI